MFIPPFRLTNPTGFAPCFAFLWLFHFSHILIELTHQQIILYRIFFFMGLLLLPYQNPHRFLAPHCSQCFSSHAQAATAAARHSPLEKCLISEPLLELISSCPSHILLDYQWEITAGHTPRCHEQPQAQLSTILPLK